MVRRFWTKTKETAGLEGQRRSGEGGHGGGTKRVSETDDGWVDLWTCGLLSVLLCSFLPSFLHLKHPCLWSSWLRPGHVFVDVWQCSRGMFSVLLVEFGRRLTARSGWRWRGWTLRLLSDFVSSLTAWSIYQLSQWGWRMRPRLSGAAFFPLPFLLLSHRWISSWRGHLVCHHLSWDFCLFETILKSHIVSLAA